MSKDKQGSKAGKTYENGDEMLSGEIRSLRALAKRVAVWGDAPQIKLEDLLKILEFHGRASTRLAKLLREERDLEKGPDANSLLDEVIDEVLEEMKAEGRNEANNFPAGSAARPDAGLLNGQ
jgi:hypothetical protein